MRKFMRYYKLCRHNCSRHFSPRLVPCGWYKMARKRRSPKHIRLIPAYRQMLVHFPNWLKGIDPLRNGLRSRSKSIGNVRLGCA